MNAAWVANVKPILKEKNPVFFLETYSRVDTFPSVKGPGLTIIAIDQTMGEAVRTALLPFHNHFRNISLVDAGDSLQNDNEIILEICKGVLSEGSTPVLLGLSPEQSAWLAAQENWNMYQVSNRLRKMAVNDHDLLQQFIAYQRHFSPLEEIYNTEEHAFNSVSLGKMRTYPTLLEPILRDAQLLHIDLNAMRAAETPHVEDAIPTGLNTEELCQLAKYAGMGDRLQCLCFYCHNIVESNTPEASIIAETLWYFAEGLNMNTHDHPDVSQDFSEFVIYSESMEDDLEFVRHNQTMKWWLRVKSDTRTNYLACSLEEYQATIDHELPERLARFLEFQEG